MADNKVYWQAMELHARCLRGEISEEQLQAEPAWQLFEQLKEQWSEGEKRAKKPETISAVLQRRREP